MQRNWFLGDLLSQLLARPGQMRGKDDKREDVPPLDPVARFHLGNGAEIYALHAGANMSQNGLTRSSGVMVNYRYDLKKTERNHKNFATGATVAASKFVRALSTAAFGKKPKEESA